MKKRLLSAALALAMVLTLLPFSAVPAFAASAGGTASLTPPAGFTGTTVANGIVSMTYHTANTTIGDITYPQDGWYYVNSGATQKLYAVSGVVEATGNWTNGMTSTWYATAQLAVDSGKSSFKLIANDSISDTKNLTSLTVNLNGNNLTWSASITKDTKLGSLEFTDSLDTTGAIKAGSVVNGAITVAQNSAGNGKNFSLTLTNVKMGTGNDIAVYHVGTGSVKVNNAEVNGITVKGVPATSTATVLSANGKVEVSGALAKAGAISVESTNNGDVDITNVSTNKITSIALKGYGTHLDIQSSKVGAVTVFGTTDTAQKAQNAADINVSGYGCVVDSVAKTADTGDVLTKGVTLDITENGSVGTVTLPNAAVKVDNGSISTKLTLESGTLNLGRANATNRSNVTALELGHATDTTGSVAVTLYQQGNSNLGAVTEVASNANGITLTVPAHPSNPSLDNNTITSVTPTVLANWTKYTIAGGKFATAITDANLVLLNASLLYEDAVGGTTTYWPIGKIDELVAYWGNGGTHTTKIIGSGTPDATVTFYKGMPAGTTGSAMDQYKVFSFGYLKANATAKKIPIQLPGKVGGQSIVEWKDGANSPWSGYQSFELPSAPASDKVDFNADTLGYTVTKVNDVAVPVGSNPGVEARLVGNEIQLKGPVTGVMAGSPGASINLVLKTDAGDVDITATWVPDTNSLTFSSDPGAATSGSIRVTDGGKAIQLMVNSTKYTLVNAGLKVEAVGLDFDGNTTAKPAKVVATSTVYTGANAKYNNDELAKAMSGGSVDFQNSPAVQEAFGAAIVGIDKAQVDRWRTEAQNKAFKTQNNTNANPTTETERTGTGYSQVVAVLYMDVRVSQWSDSATPGSLTAVMTPYMRVEVRHSSDPTGVSTDQNTAPIVVRAGQPLRALTSQVGSVVVNLPVGSTYTATGNVAHQNNTYAYTVTEGTVDSKKTAAFTITHAAANGSGFGTIVLNKVDAPVEVKKPATAPGTGYESFTEKKLYDTIQAAVDDAKDGQRVEVLSPMNQNFPISMRGDARTITIDTKGNATVSNATTNNVVFNEDSKGHLYTFQLTRSSAVTPTEKPVAITVATAANGAATSSAARADYGETVTITVRPNAGYGLSTLTIRTNTGANVAYQSTTTNVFTFKVPENVTSITVTPAFAVSSTAAISVTDTVNGLATTNAANNRAAGGSTVTVTTRPFNGYRTSAVTAVSNTGAAVAVTRVAENTYTFVVPVAATSVVITPTFTASGHPFTDVPDGQWYSDAVSFGYRHGMFTGYNGSTTRFAGMERLTRAELVVILYRLSGEPATTDNSGFSDVGSGIWYSKAITWATRNNIVRGGDNNRFYPLNNVTREELAQMLYNYNSYRRGSAGLTGNLSRFTDSNRVHSYHLTAMQWAVGNGIVQGNNNSQLNPGGTASRYEVAVMLMRYGQSFMGLT